MNNYPGKLIVLYGINNLGKSTQAKLLVEKLKFQGYRAEYLKYPVYDIKPSGEILNDYLRNGNNFQLSPREAQIIYTLNRDQYQSELIKKLKSGINIIAEDYKGTGIAWGLGAGVDEKFLKSINSHLIDEDLVFLFNGERFRQAIEEDHQHENNDDLINKVRWAHLKLREEYGWFKINANLAIEEIHQQIWNQVITLLEGNKNKINSSWQTIGEIINNNHKNNLIEITSEDNNNPTIDFTQLPVEKVKTEAKLPQKAHQNDAGYDLYSTDYYSIPPYGQALVDTGIKLAIPQGFVGLIWDKSGLANQGITTMGGVIDASYRGEIKVVIKNLSEDIFNIVPGQKIAQILIQPIANLIINEQKIIDQTGRQSNGFGSSGKF